MASYYGCSLSWGKQLKISSALHWDKQVISSNLFLLRGGFALSFVGSTAQAGLLRPLLADSSLDALTCTLSQDLGSSLYSAHGPATFMSTVVYHPENAMHCCRVGHRMSTVVYLPENAMHCCRVGHRMSTVVYLPENAMHCCRVSHLMSTVVYHPDNAVHCCGVSHLGTVD